MVSKRSPPLGQTAFLARDTVPKYERPASTPSRGMTGLHQPTSSASPTWTDVGVTSTKDHSNSKKALTTIKTDGSMLMTPQNTSPPTLPSLLRYIDHHLMQTATLHNRPPHPTATCTACNTYWDAPSILQKTTLATNPSPLPTLSTFLLLTPCNHWVHYQCLIIRACDPSDPYKDCCPLCDTRLYEWDGVTALTLATRTGLRLVDTNPRGHFTTADATGPISFLPSDNAVYISECALIDTLIHQAFFTQLNLASKYADGSPDLVQAYYDVLMELDKRGSPKGKWLRWSTQIGFLLFGMLVVIKMRRYLLEGQGGIVRTEAWMVFEDGRQQLQQSILEAVHGDGT